MLSLLSDAPSSNQDCTLVSSTNLAAEFGCCLGCQYFAGSVQCSKILLLKLKCFLRAKVLRM